MRDGHKKILVSVCDYVQCHYVEWWDDVQAATLARVIDQRLCHRLESQQNDEQLLVTELRAFITNLQSITSCHQVHLFRRVSSIWLIQMEFMHFREVEWFLEPISRPDDAVIKPFSLNLKFKFRSSSFHVLFFNIFAFFFNADSKKTHGLPWKPIKTVKILKARHHIVRPQFASMFKTLVICKVYCHIHTDIFVLIVTLHLWQCCRRGLKSYFL